MYIWIEKKNKDITIEVYNNNNNNNNKIHILSQSDLSWFNKDTSIWCSSKVSFAVYRSII
jgi:hypothetical protein